MVLRLQRGGKRTLPRVGTARAISIVIVAEVRLYRDGLARSLDGRDGIHVVGTAVGLADALAQVRDHSPDVVLLDFGPDGKSWLRALVEETPEAKVIVVGLGEDEADVIVCAEAGASGFVGRESSLEH